MKRSSKLLICILFFLALGSIPQGRGLMQQKTPQRALREKMLYEPAYFYVHTGELASPQAKLNLQAPAGVQGIGLTDFYEVFQHYSTIDQSWNLFFNSTTALTYRGGVNVEPRFNFSGSQVLFVSNSGSTQFDIFRINRIDRQVVNLTNSPEEEASPDWSPDASQIVFAKKISNDWEIFKMNADGSNLVQLTTSAGYDGEPSWSHDGKKIAFVSIREGNYLIYTMNPDGSEITVVNPADNFSAHPQWSRFDDWLGYDADNDQDGFQELWKIKLDGTGATLLADEPGKYMDFYANQWLRGVDVLIFTRVTWVYMDGKWYWSEAGIGTDPSSIYGWFDWNETIAPIELIPPETTLTLNNPSGVIVNQGDYQTNIFSFQSSASDNLGGVSVHTIEWREAGLKTWTIYCQYFNYKGGFPCTDPPSFHGLGGKTYIFRATAQDDRGNISIPSPANTITVTVEGDAPITWWWKPLPTYSRGRSVFLGITANDILVNGISSGLKTILGEVKEPGGVWTQVFDPNFIPQSFTGDPGKTYCFRFRGVDYALNVGPYSAPDPAPCTTLYDWGISGSIYNNREQTVNTLQLSVQPEPSHTYSITSTGVYSAYLGFDVLSPAPAAVDVSFHNPSFGNLPPVGMDTNLDSQRDVTLPPLDDQIQNGQFEDLLTGWKSSGIVNIGANLSGWSGLELGASLQLKQSVTFTASGGGADGLVDAKGDLHIVSTNTIAIFYRHCTAQGQCDPPARLVDTGSVVFNPKIRQNSKGDLFVIWGDMLNGVEMVRIVEKPTGGQWSEVTNLMKGNTPDLLIDPQDNLIVISKEDWKGVAAATRIASGTWITGTLLYTNNGEAIHHLAYNLSPSGRAYVMFGASCDGSQNNPCTYLFQWDPQNGWTSSKATPIHYYENYDSDGFPLVITQDPVSHKEFIHFAYRYAIDTPQTYLFRYVVIDPQTLQQVGLKDIRVPNTYSMKAVLTPAAPDDVFLFVLSGTEIYWTHGLNNPAHQLLEAQSPGWMWVREINGTPTVFWATFQPGPSQIMGCPLLVSGCMPQVFAEVNGVVDGFEMMQNSLAFLVRQTSGNGLALYDSWLPSASNRVSQPVTISAKLSNPTLSFYYREIGFLNKPDFRVLLDSRPNLTGSLQTTELFSSTLPVSSWNHVWRDLTPWAGQVVTLTFQSSMEAGSLPFLVNLDEISLGSSMPDLQLSGGRVASLLPGETGVYTLTYKNSGSLPAPTAMITVTLPLGLQFAPSGSQPQVGPQSKTWQLGTLAAGSSGQISFAVVQAFTPKTLTTAQITAELNTPVVDPEPGNNSQVFVLWLAKSRLFTPMLQR